MIYFQQVGQTIYKIRDGAILGWILAPNSPDGMREVLRDFVGIKTRKEKDES